MKMKKNLLKMALLAFATFRQVWQAHKAPMCCMAM